MIVVAVAKQQKNEWVAGDIADALLMTGKVVECRQMPHAGGGGGARRALCVSISWAIRRPCRYGRPMMFPVPHNP